MDALSQLGINFTSVWQYLINILLLVVALIWVLYKPIIATLDKRRAIIKNSLSEAEVLSKEFEKKMEEMKQEQLDMSRRLEEEAELTRKALAESRIAFQQEMEAKKKEMYDKAEKEIAAAKANIIQSTERQILESMQKILQTVIGRDIDKSIVAKSVESEWSAFKNTHQM